MVYIFLATGFEEIEAIAVIDVLRRANIDVLTVSISGNSTVVGTHGVPVIADILFENADVSKADMLILPGGMPGTMNLAQHEGLKSLLLTHHDNDGWIAAICAAPSLLGQLKILQGKNAVCYPSFEKQLNGASVLYDDVVCSNKIITSRGPGFAIKFALKIVEKISSEEVANSVASDLLL